MTESTSSTTLPCRTDMDFAHTFGAGWRDSDGATRGSSSSPMTKHRDPLSAVMQRYASGEDQVFERLYELLAPRLYRFCLRLTSRRHEADDCFQETLLKLHRSRATYSPGVNTLHWIFAIARSVYLSRLRYWRRRPETVGSACDIAEAKCSDGSWAHDATPEAEVAAQHLQTVLAAELQGMSERNRVAYILMKEENLTAKEAAVILGTTPEVVRQRAHRAHEQLRATLRSAGWGDQDVEAV